ncbi:PREDICTED: fibronectin type III domain-containing protein 5-like [Branchiostoma belcheri]|uniref:Fibronectin type III domain-containing protein 5-like n=1 Tax=Branchiostoma belcheri TaxID=7741 RepID=A0A6P4ZSI2_BRABE|nr:PREDICTED: fibronectin type III domain-containing protein 5-like [Branchiostoma belcheri]
MAAHLPLLPYGRLVVMVVLSVCARARSCLQSTGFPTNASFYRPYNVTLADVASETATVHWDYGWPPQPDTDLTTHNCTDRSGHTDTNATDLALTGFDVVTRVVGDLYDTRTITTVDASRRSLPLTYLKQETTYVVYVYAIHDDIVRLRSGETEFSTTADYSEDGDAVTPLEEDGEAYDYVTEEEKKLTIEELVLIGVVILVWLSVIGLFLRQWDHIRGMAPRDTMRPRPPTPKPPTNEEYPTITIVQDEKDSLIRTTRF